MKKIVLALSLVVAGAAFASPGSAPFAGPQPRTLEDRRLAQKGDGGPGEGKRGALRERVRQKVQTYVTVELATRAGLDDKKSLQLGTALKAHMERKQTARQQKKAELEKLRALVDSKGNDAALKAQMKAVVDVARDEDQLQLLLDDTARFLTPTEQARVMTALPGVMKDTMKMVREARHNGGGGGGRRGGGGGAGGGGGGFGGDFDDVDSDD